MPETETDMMAGLRNVFGRHDVEDDTGDETPAGRGGGLSRLVQPTPAEATPATALSPTSPPHSPGTDDLVTQIPRAPREGAGSQRRLRRKTSLSLPPAVRRRITDIYTINRWTFAELVEQGLTRLRDGQIRLIDVERALLASTSDEGATTKTVALPVDVLDDLDRYASEWRLSRSQLVAAIVDSVIETL